MHDEACPLCGRTRHMRKENPLYGTPVCRKCFYAFTSRRQCAYVIDAVLWWPIGYALAFAAASGLSAADTDPQIAGLAFLTLWWIALPMVFFLKDGMRGHSPGKLIAGVRVVDAETYEPIGPLASLKRNLPLIVPIVMPLFIGFTLAKGPRVGDGWARTKVVWKKHAANPVFTGGATCARCMYDLRATEGDVCPECGERISAFAGRMREQRRAEATISPDSAKC